MCVYSKYESDRVRHWADPLYNMEAIEAFIRNCHASCDVRKYNGKLKRASQRKRVAASRDVSIFFLNIKVSWPKATDGEKGEKDGGTDRDEEAQNRFYNLLATEWVRARYLRCNGSVFWLFMHGHVMVRLKYLKVFAALHICAIVFGVAVAITLSPWEVFRILALTTRCRHSYIATCSLARCARAQTASTGSNVFLVVACHSIATWM